MVEPKPDVVEPPKPELVEPPKPDIVEPPVPAIGVQPTPHIVEPPKPVIVEPPKDVIVEPPTPDVVEPPTPIPVEPPVVKKPEPLSEERLNKLIELSSMYGETKDGRFVGPTVVMSEGKPIGTAVFDDEGRTFRYSLTDNGVLYEGRAVFSWETKKCTVDQHPDRVDGLSEPPRL